MVPVRLRGHHFLCVLTYRGLGYTDAFVANMSEKVQAIRKGAPVVLVRGPDDICNGFTDDCRNVSDHDCSARSTLTMDIDAVAAVSALLGRPLENEMVLLSDDIVRLREAYKEKTIRAACTDCSWKDFCDRIADDDFSGTLL